MARCLKILPISLHFIDFAAWYRSFLHVSLAFNARVCVCKCLDVRGWCWWVCHEYISKALYPSTVRVAAWHIPSSIGSTLSDFHRTGFSGDATGMGRKTWKSLSIFEWICGWLCKRHNGTTAQRHQFDKWSHLVRPKPFSVLCWATLSTDTWTIKWKWDMIVTRILRHWDAIGSLALNVQIQKCAIVLLRATLTRLHTSVSLIRYIIPFISLFFFSLSLFSICRQRSGRRRRCRQCQ